MPGAGGIKISPEQLEQLSRFNGLAGSVFTLDTVLRAVSYSGLWGAEMLRSINGDKSPTAAFLVEFFNKLTDARFVNRCIGLPATLESLFQSENDPVQHLMDWSMVVYYPLEHVWWLSTLTPTIVNIDSNKWSMWSCRAWTVYCVCDVVRTLSASSKLQAEVQRLEGTTAETSEKTRRVSELKRRRSHLNLWATCAVADLIMAVQWSRPTPIVSDKMITLIGIYGGVAGLWLKWLKSRKVAAPKPSTKQA